MAGIYIHIPFCTKICHYCDFYKTANNKLKTSFIDRLIDEIEVRKYFLTDTFDTIYFGGGTPSVISKFELEQILDALYSNYRIARKVETTIEVNPDDINLNYLKGLKSIGFNRLSIGIQSFKDSILKYLNRRHDSLTAQNALKLATEAGFNNISGDLIYGIPNQTIEDFERDLNLMKSLNINHLSAYHLGIEEGTYFGKLHKLGRIKEISEEMSELFFNFLSDWSLNNRFEHYEISNFALDSAYSNHNRNYWFGVPYIGFGPSAHSFDGNNRFFNISNLNKYLNYSKEELLNPEMDKLDQKDKYNEFILLRLRTKWGINTTEINEKFSNYFFEHTMRIFFKFKDSNYLRSENDTIYLTKEGFFASDFIVREFFVI